MPTPEEIAAAEAAAAEAAAAEEAERAAQAAAEEAARVEAEEEAARAAAEAAAKRDDGAKPKAGGKPGKKEKASPATIDAAKANPVLALAAKGGQFLTRHASGVWSYPGCPRDPSATHMVYPEESVSDDAVREAILDGDVAVTLIDIHGQAAAVRVIVDGEELPRAVSTLDAGSLDAATSSQA